jgi:hypothetical protein
LADRRHRLSTVAVIHMSNSFPSLVRLRLLNDLMVSPLRNRAAISLISSAAILRDQGRKIHLQGLGFAVAVHGLSPFVPGRNLSLEIQYHDGIVGVFQDNRQPSGRGLLFLPHGC